MVKSHKEVTKKLFLLDDRRIRIQEAQKLVDPTDPDPQHCSQAHKTACLTVVQSLTQGVGSMKLEPTATARPAAVVNRGKEGKTLAITANLIR
jgi:hypothetical protein